jgi:hypothetical protein
MDFEYSAATAFIDRVTAGGACPVARRSPGRPAAGPLFPRHLHGAGIHCGHRLQNKTVVYDILLKAAAETIRVIGADPQHLDEPGGSVRTTLTKQDRTLTGLMRKVRNRGFGPPCLDQLRCDR